MRALEPARPARGVAIAFAFAMAVGVAAADSSSEQPIHVRLEPNVEYTLRVRAHATPRRSWGVWPFAANVASGLAKFTFIQ